jgi:fluoroquinolone transport system permease protein
MASRFVRLAAADARMVARDPLLAIMPFAPLLAATAMRLIIPPVAGFLLPRLGFDLLAWGGLIRGILILFPGMFYGMVAGFLLLDDRDDGIAAYWSVTPVRRSGYLLARLGLFTLFAVPAGLACGLIIGSGPLRWGHELAMAVLGALQVPVYSLFLAAFAANKVEGLSIVKALGILNMAPLAVLLPGSVGRLGWPVPQYWAAAGYLSGLQGLPDGIPAFVHLPISGGTVPVYGLSALLYAVWTASLLHRYLRRLE